MAMPGPCFWPSPAPMGSPGSFRIESHGVISALLFLQECAQCFPTAIEQNITHLFACGDRESLLKRIHCALTQLWVNPSQCLASDFDLKSGILDITAVLSVSFKHPHVKRHQDNATQVHLLPWVAQRTNVLHDGSLATCCLDNCVEPSETVSFIPASQASLTINNKTITRHFAQ